MNILVTGANGQLGHEMQICAQKSNHKFVFTDVAEGYEKLDITNLDAIREKVRENDIQVIVNCAAYTNVDKAETDYDLVNLLNNTAAGNLAQAMKEVDGALIHVSTDYVFQGDKNIPCREDWETNPLGVYGKTKLAGSFIVLHVCVLSALRHSHSGLSCFLMIRSRTFFDGSKGFILFSKENKKSEPFSYRKKVRILLLWCTSRDSNPGPTD